MNQDVIQLARSNSWGKNGYGICKKNKYDTVSEICEFFSSSKKLMSINNFR